MTVNYSPNQSSSLRAERGQVKSLVYTSPFWAAYHHLPNHKTAHWVTLACLVVVSVGVNLVVCWLLLGTF